MSDAEAEQEEQEGTAEEAAEEAEQAEAEAQAEETEAAEAQLELEERLDDLAERAETASEGLREYVDDPDVELDELRERFEDEEDSEEALEYVKDLWEVADELEDVLQTIDLSDLPDAIEFEKLPELVEADEIPEALSDDDKDLGDVVKLRKLLKVIDLSELWGAADVRSFWKQKRELEDEVDDVTDDDGDDDDDSFGPDLDVTDDDEEMMDDVDWEMPDFDGIEDYDPESAENAIQMKMMDGVEKMREALLEAHDKLKTVREENRDRMARQDNSTNSRNPTAVSTMPTGDRLDIGSATRFSTVPRETRHSSAPNKDHIYGNRFDREDNDE